MKRRIEIESLLLMELTGDDVDINTVLTYYTASLPEAVGKQYRPPSLDLLVQFWFDSSGKHRRLILGSQILICF